MSAGDRDRLEETLRDKERADEDRYFRERDRRLLERMNPARTPEAQDTQHAADMRCPRCGVRLEPERLLGVTADACPECAGLWLDRTALEQAVVPRTQPGWLARCFGRIIKG